MRTADLPDTTFAAEETERGRLLEQEIEDLAPTPIPTHPGHDQHRDHHATQRAAVRVGRRCSSILDAGSSARGPRVVESGYDRRRIGKSRSTRKDEGEGNADDAVE